MPEATANQMSQSFPGDLILRAGAACAVLRPAAGGRVCSLSLARVDGRPVAVLFPYTAEGVDPVRWAKGGIYPLVPYSNRIANAQLQTSEGMVRLSPHPDASPHTLHGPAHGLPWSVSAQDENSATLTLDHAASPAWPWHFQALMRFRLLTDSLHMDLTLTNLDVRTMPAGLGWHPFFLHELQATLRYKADKTWIINEAFLAQSPRNLQSDEWFDKARVLREGPVTDYLSEWDGLLEMSLPEGYLLQMVTAPMLSHLVVHRPAEGVYLCIEPVSHVANGFNLAAQGVPGTGTVQLARGESMAGPMTLRLLS